MNINNTPFDDQLSERLIIRRPNSRAPFHFDIRGEFNATVVRKRFALDTDFGLNLTDRFFDVAVAEKLPEAPITDKTDPNFERDIAEYDQLIRTQFYTAEQMDTDKKLKGLKGDILQIVDIQTLPDIDQTLIFTKQIGSL